MPAPILKQVIVNHKCPKCNRRITRNLTYVQQKRGIAQANTEYTCWCKFCEARIKTKYRIIKKRDGSPRIKVYNLSVDGEEFVKRFKVLGWV